jgi:hypothetical protein
MLVDLEAKAEKSKHMLLFHHQNAGQNHDIKIVTDALKMWYSLNTSIWERQ